MRHILTLHTACRCSILMNLSPHGTCKSYPVILIEGTPMRLRGITASRDILEAHRWEAHRGCSMHTHRPGDVVRPASGHRMYSHQAVIFSPEVPLSVRSAAFGHPSPFVVFISLAYKPVEPSSSSSFDRRIRIRSPSLIAILVIARGSGVEPRMLRTGTNAPSK